MGGQVELPFPKPFNVSSARAEIWVSRVGCRGSAALRARNIMPSSLSVVEEAPARAGQATIAPTINDLAIRVGTVNGSGSQSANLVILRALYAMGIPCSGKNVFPSNIEGLPTWFHIRASAKGYVGHRLDPQVLVCMNEQTAKDDVLAAQARARSASIATTSTWT